VASVNLLTQDRNMANVAALSVLRASPIFRGLSQDLLEHVSRLCRTRSYGRGETIFVEGSPGHKLYGVVAGRLLITTTSSQGLELHLNVAGPGEIIGEIAFLDGGTRTATARAAELTTCFELDRPAFFTLLEQHPQLGAHLLQLVCRRVREMTKLAADSAFLSVSQRLASRLRSLAMSSGEGCAAEIRISQAELADFLGVSRQVVNGYLQVWKRNGVVDLGRGAIRIKDMSAL
jgi:CRP/FNR family transcriptional regulator, cyclic AMP receptor protein